MASPTRGGMCVAKVAGVLLIGLVFAAPVIHPHLDLLHTFAGGSDGAEPRTTPVLDTGGNLYGTTLSGGAYDGGLIFEVDNAGKFTTLYSFTNGSDGSAPNGLALDNEGNLYGTTAGGGDGFGTVFKFTPGGTGVTVLYTFSGGDDGSTPEAGLVMDSAGNLYGTAYTGGSGGFGTVFKISTTNEFSVLYSFEGGADGADPLASLILDAQGNLYGTTGYGGSFATSCPIGCGVVFELTPTAHGPWEETLLYTFIGGSDGGGPEAGLVMDSAGNLYGTTFSGGSIGGNCGLGCGVVFKIDTAGTETVLHSFTGKPDGESPTAGLLLDSQNNLFGTTSQGGPHELGTVFKMSSSGGTETVVHGFKGGDGQLPIGGLAADSEGNLYGTASSGGHHTKPPNVEGDGPLLYKCCRGTAYRISNP
jgi:uncharacterized repeat protein (TIGR03803 family)